MPDSLHVGVTGTRHPLTEAQIATLTAVLMRIGAGAAGLVTLHHGCCTGADQAAHRIARILGWPVEARPGIGADGRSPWRARGIAGEPGVTVHEPRRYYLRNRDISEACSILVACPAYPEDDPRSARSGTWQTARDARSRGQRIILVQPDGKTQRDRDTETFRRARIPGEVSEDA